MTSAEKRLKLFETNSTGMVALGLGLPDTFVCPLCMSVFSKDALDPKYTPKGPEYRLTLDHIIPDALGGSLCTLACKECNNGMGNSLEAVLKEQFVVEDAVNGTGKLRARLIGEFGNVAVDVNFPSNSGQTLLLEELPENSNPAHIKSLEKMLVGTEENPLIGPRSELNFKFEHQPGIVGAALYHSAYLMMFHYFGYPFALSILGKQIRAQLREPDKHILSRYFPVPPEEWVAANVDAVQKHAVVLIQDPYVGIHVMLRFQPTKGLPRVIGVALADFDGKSWPTVPGGRVRGLIARIKKDGVDLPPWVPRAWPP